MADVALTKKQAAVFMGFAADVFSFAKSIHPLFGVVSDLLKTGQKAIDNQVAHQALVNDFNEINSQLKSISEKNKEFLKKIKFFEITKKYGDLEEGIKQQYEDFNTLIAKLKKDPENADQHKNTFKQKYEKNDDKWLCSYYEGVVGKETVFGSDLLQVYMEQGELETMEHVCSHLTNVLHIGLMALMAFVIIAEDDVQEEQKKWKERMTEVQEKIDKVLEECQKNKK